MLRSTLALLLIFQGYLIVSGQPSNSISDLLSHSRKLDSKENPNDETSGLSFQQFIQQAKQPDSVVIAEFKPNASDLEVLMLRNKIAATIASMKNKETTQLNESFNGPQNNCFIERTKVERIAGRCVKVSGGLPICQSEAYMAISPDCNQA